MEPLLDLQVDFWEGLAIAGSVGVVLIIAVCINIVACIAKYGPESFRDD